jgi:hypothetical protein
MDLHIKHIEAEVPPWVLTAIGGSAHGLKPPTISKPKLKADPSALPEQKRPRCARLFRSILWPLQ